MERRVLLAIFLCFLVLYAWQALFVKPAPKRPAVAANGAPSSPPPVLAGSKAPEPGLTPSSTVVSGAAPVLGSGEERDYPLENCKIIAVLTNRGGRLKCWKLKG